MKNLDSPCPCLLVMPRRVSFLYPLTHSWAVQVLSLFLTHLKPEVFEALIFVFMQFSQRGFKLITTTKTIIKAFTHSVRTLGLLVSALENISEQIKPPVILKFKLYIRRALRKWTKIKIKTHRMGR